MSSSLRVNTIVPSTGTNVAIGTANGTVTFIDSVNFVLGTGSSIFSPASNTLTFGTNDAERLRIDSDGNVLVGTTDATIYNNGDSDSEGIVLRGGEVIDIARKGDLQLTLNRQTNDGFHVGFFRSGSPKSYIATRDDAFCIDVNNSERLRITSDGKVRVPDNGKFVAGAGDDLQIYHDGSHSYVLDNGTGDLRLASNSITRITKGDSETCAAFNVDGASELYYDNSKKLETTSYGANITGDLRISDNSARLHLYDMNATDNTACTGGFEVFDQNGNRGVFMGATESASNLHFGIRNAEKMRITYAGNVGINDTAPSEKLNVGGNIMLEGGDQYLYLTNAGTGNSGIYVRGRDSTSELRSHSTGIFTWEVTGIEKMRLTSSTFKVGGNTLVSPNGNADNFVIDTGDVDSGLSILSATTGRIYFGDATDAAAGSIRYVHTDNSMRFEAAGGEKLRITSDGDVGIGENGPTARLHVRSTGITAGAPSEGWPDWNADNDNNAKIVALLETAGNGDNNTSGHGASVVLRMGQYYDSRAVISPVPAGGASPSDQGVGHGKDLMVKGGRSDNNNGRNGGRLFLDGGGGFNSGSFGNLIGDVILQSQGGYIGLNGQTNPEYPFDLIDGNNRAYFTQGSDSTMSLVMYDNSSHPVSVKGHGGQLRLNVTPTSGGSLEPCMKFNTEGDAIIGRGYNDDPTSNRRLVVKDTNAIVRIESPGSASGDYTQLEFKTGSTSAWIWKNPTSNTNYGGADSLNIYHTQNADIAFLTNGNNVRFKVRGDGHLQVGTSTNNFVKNEYKGSVSVTGTNNESFAFEIQGASYGSGGLLYIYGTSGNVVVNVSAEILVNHSQDVTIRSMSGAYTQARIRVKTDNNARAAIYLGRSGGYASGTTSLNWKFIPFGGTYLYLTESTNTGMDHTHSTVSGSFNLTAVGGGAGNVNASGSKNFLINHPLVGLATTTRLAHAAVEGPECNTMYRGKVDLVDGTASVNIDTNSRMTEGTFVALNQNVQCFTTNETGWTAIKGSVSGNLLTITAQDNTCTDTISWMVVGERHDQDIINNRATDSEGRFIPEVTDEYDASQFAAYTNPVEPESEPDNTEERDPTV